jgi:hypothetical protein
MSMSHHRADRYQLLRHLRSTPLGPGFEAQHPRRPGHFLVELLNGIDADSAARRAFERDVMAVAGLRHPYIVQVVELAAMPDGTPIIVSELGEGETLAASLAHGNTLLPETLTYLIAALADALTAAHALGVRHGNVSADNVVLLPSTSAALGLPKLQGFGLATLQGRHVRESEDVAALGALGERLLTPPDLRETSGERAFFLPPGLKDVFARAAGADGKEPFRTPAELAAALERAVKTASAPGSLGGRSRAGQHLWPMALALGTAATFAGATVTLRAGFLPVAAVETRGPAVVPQAPARVHVPEGPTQASMMPALSLPAALSTNLLFTAAPPATDPEPTRAKASPPAADPSPPATKRAVPAAPVRRREPRPAPAPREEQPSHESATASASAPAREFVPPASVPSAPEAEASTDSEPAGTPSGAEAEDLPEHTDVSPAPTTASEAPAAKAPVGPLVPPRRRPARLPRAPRGHDRRASAASPCDVRTRGARRGAFSGRRIPPAACPVDAHGGLTRSAPSARRSLRPAAPPGARDRPAHLRRRRGRRRPRPDRRTRARLPRAGRAGPR